MALYTGRMGLRYPQPADSNNVPQDIQALATELDLLCVTFLQGVSNARPNSTAPTGVPAQGNYNPGTQGRWYWATDTSQLSYDYGGGWFTVPSVLSYVTTKGDLLVAQSNAALARLGAGGDGQALVSRSGATLGLDWETQIGQSMGLPGAATPTRYVGATSSNGPPSGGSFQAGDYVVCPSGGRIWICQTGGNPGIWIEVGSQSPAFSAYVAGFNVPPYYYYNVTGWRNAGLDTHGAITSSGYVIPKPGYWAFGYNIVYPQSSPQAARFARLLCNGDPSGGNHGPGFTYTVVSNNASASNAVPCLPHSFNYPVYLYTGDVIGIQTSQNSGGSVSLMSGAVDCGSSFWGRWIHS